MANGATEAQRFEREEQSELCSVVSALRDEVRVLRHAIDEFRVDFTHCLRNLPNNLPPSYAHLGAMLESFSNDVRPTNSVPIEPSNVAVADNPVAPSTAAVETNTSEPTPNLVAPPVVKSPVSPPPSSRKKKSPLSMRIVQKPVYTDVVRLIGYQTMKSSELRSRLDDLKEKYSIEALEEAVEELLKEIGGGWQLSPRAREHAFQILGKPK